MAGLGKMMKQMAKMQKKMATLQEELAEQELQVSSGGGAVTVTVSLQSEVKAIKLDPEFLKEDADLIEETLLEAVQDALKQAGEKSEAAMQAVTAEFQVPGMPGF
jgi:DNA-binding YbaB/EbfC family protein